MAGSHGRGAKRSVADDDLLLGDHLGDLVIVAQTVLQAQDHGVPVDHRQRIADSRLQVLIVYENDQQIHHTDLKSRNHDTDRQHQSSE